MTRNGLLLKCSASKTAIATAFLLCLTDDIIVLTGSTHNNHIKESLTGKIKFSKEDWFYL